MSDEVQPDEVLFERDGGLLVITLNRPEAKNAMTRAIAVQVEAAIDDFDSDPEQVVAIVTGAGGSFCSGMDLKGFLRGELPIADRRGFAGLTTVPPTKPIIAAVEGYALAGGFEVVLACDLVVAAENAKFGLPEVKRGLCAAAGGLFRLPDRIPYHQAMEMILTGEFVGAPRLAELGLVNRLTPPGGALAGARALAEVILGNGPLAVRGSKQVVVGSRGWAPDERLARQAEITNPVRASQDAREGARAFAEKRTPEWRGE